MKTIDRIREISEKLNSLQASLGRLSSTADRELQETQRLAANLSLDIEIWHLDLLHIPASERDVYLLRNPYIGDLSSPLPLQ
ncbi:hypothetical protein AB6825_09920 [Serratia proteamaculans]|uniref:hypothetical protein n=1 Tax=Serratia proteamaculans TaxID=28151 RepID=UPI0032F0D0FC|nr:hypothetical protein [Yersinia enterocolitica]